MASTGGLRHSNKKGEDENSPVQRMLRAQESQGSRTPTKPADESATTGEYDASTSSTGGFYNPKGESPSGLKTQEETAGSSENEEENDDGTIGSGYNADNSSSTRGRARFKITRRRAAVGSGVLGLVIGGGFWGISIIQGPFQMVHFAQLLQKFHLGSNEDFGDDRGAKLMLYALAGNAERARLGAGMNRVADSWENRMVKKSGLRPLFSSRSGRLVGYEIVSSKRDRNDALQEVLRKNPELRGSFERAADNGAELLSRDEALARGGLRGTASRTGQGKVIDKGHYVIDFRGVNERGFKETRVFTRGVGHTIIKPKIVGAMGSRLLIKRGGVSFHFFNNVKKAVDASADANTRKKQDEEYKDGILKRWAESVKVGVKTGVFKNKESEDVAKQVEAETEGKTPSESRVLRTAIAKGAGPTAVVGLVCTVKSLGDDASAVKYTNNVLPMMRMGMGIVTMGNQVMSGQKINMDELGVMSKQLYDEQSKTSFQQARSVQAELGQPQTGPDLPKEAKLSNVSDKGDVFQTVDFITGLGIGPISIGTACGAIDKVAGLLGPINSIIQKAIDAPLGLAGTSSEELMGDLIAVINGDSVNPLAQGAELGNLANTGAFLAANDQAIATGGTALSGDEVAQLKQDQALEDKQNRSDKAFFARYFDPYDSGSVAGKALDSNVSVSGIASLPGEGLANGIASLMSVFQPRAKAAEGYDYGASKYGFSLADQEDDRFEDPYANAAVVEPQLAALNDKYGKCFGVTVGEDGSLQNGESVNVFKLEHDGEYKDCRDNKNDEMFKRYRFYIADTVTAKSLKCYEGDSQSCTELGADGSGGSDSSANDTTISGSAQELAQKILSSRNVTLQPNPRTSIEAAARGEKSPAGVDKCGVQHPPVNLSPELLGFLAELADQDSYTITSLTTGAHACDSNHYKGTAADFGCDIDVAKADRIGGKYGISHNFESCADAIPHWHYSIGGN